MTSQEIDLVEYFNVIKKRRKLFVFCLLVIIAGGAIRTWLQPRLYLSQSQVMPLDSQSGGALGMLKSQLAGMPLMSGLGGGMTGAQRIQMYLKSRTFAEFAVTNLDLTKKLIPDAWDASKNDWAIPESERPETIQSAIDAFRGSIQIDDNNDGTLMVGAKWTDKQIAFDLANQIVAQLEAFMATNVFSDSRKDRIFLEKQLELNQRELLETGKKLSQYYQANNISPASGRVDVNVGVKGESLVTNHFFGAPLSADEINKTVTELNQAKANLDKKVDSAVLVEDVPQNIYLEYLTMRRTILTTLNMMLNQQYQLSRIEEIKEEDFFNIVDQAQMPAGPFKPNVKLAMTITVALAMFAAMGLVFAVEYFSQVKQSRVGRSL